MLNISISNININLIHFNLIHELKLKWKYKGNNSVTLVNMLFRHKMNDDVIQNKAVYTLSEFILH